VIIEMILGQVREDSEVDGASSTLLRAIAWEENLGDAVVTP